MNKLKTKTLLTAMVLGNSCFASPYNQPDAFVPPKVKGTYSAATQTSNAPSTLAPSYAPQAQIRDSVISSAPVKSNALEPVFKGTYVTKTAQKSAAISPQTQDEKPSYVPVFKGTYNIPVDEQSRDEEVETKAEQQRFEQQARAKAEEEARTKAEQAARAKAEEEAKTKAEQEARTKAEEEARVKAEEEARAKAEEEARAKAEEEARAKAEEEARAKAEEEARAKAEFYRQTLETHTAAYQNAKTFFRITIDSGNDKGIQLQFENGFKKNEKNETVARCVILPEHANKLRSMLNDLGYAGENLVGLRVATNAIPKASMRQDGLRGHLLDGDLYLNPEDFPAK